MPVTTVILDFDVDGFHRYPAAPAEVAFLRSSHRHLFRIQIEYTVETIDREREIFLEEAKVKQWLNERFGTPCRFGERSCEMIAHEILRAFGASSVRVLEDGRGGACVRQSVDASPRMAEVFGSRTWPRLEEPSVSRTRPVFVRLPLDLTEHRKHAAELARTLELFALRLEEQSLKLRLENVQRQIDEKRAETHAEACT